MHVDFVELFKKIGNTFLNVIQTILLVASFFLVLYIFVVQPHQVDGASMFPTFHHKEWLLSNLLAVQMGDYKRGDVIVFRAPDALEKIYIKRIIGIPGDTVMIQEGSVFLNGSVLDESMYLKSDVKTYAGAFLDEGVSVTVPQESVFVLGDNRPGSSDSRFFGFVVKEKLIGKSIVRFLPLSTFTLITNPYKK